VKRAVTDHSWWQKDIIYQIYPRSFQDSNGDGVGDLPGITSRLDYLEWLGVKAVWLSPIFPSPMADFGYDVSDYTDVHPMFGTLDDLFVLRDEIHRRDMKLILDFVPNHTSSEHAWFLDSRSSRDAARRDWYLWKDPAPDGGPPNNWRSVFGGSAWALDEATGQYYYHAFLKEQPDLNWRNPEVRKAMCDALRFWLDRGIDGFRIDVIWHLIKDDHYRDNPPNPEYHPGEASTYDELLPVYTTDRPEVHEVISEMREVFEEYEDRVMIGEIYLPIERLVTYYGNEGTGVHLPYNFQLVLLPWQARKLDATIHSYEAMIPTYGWPNWVLGNHDKSRIATRVGLAQARVAAMLLLTLRGTPTIYYGDEIGMHDVAVPPDRIRDPAEKNMPGLGLGRDPQRTPMQWDGSTHAGFSEAEPWLPLSPDVEQSNVEAKREDDRSILTLYRRLIALRNEMRVLQIGRYAPLVAPGDLLAWVRKLGKERVLVVLNLGTTELTYDLDAPHLEGTILLSTHLDREGEMNNPVHLRANEGLIIRLRGW
jgi:alpha-glucosidase